MSREQDYITEARGAAKSVWDGILKLLALQNEWDALGYTNNLDPGAGENAGITKEEVSAAVFDTANELDLRIMQTAHKTNLANLL